MTTFLAAPVAELQRSAAARAVGRMAADADLFFSHFEHRHALPLPEQWEVRDRPDLGPYPWDADGGWAAGHLPETKFRSFRLDRRIASFHPMHSPKWGAHELCHSLVGFGWAPGVSPLWHATAARLSEVLPVALWYFFDEAGLHRCRRHAGGGPLFGTRCPDCDRQAQTPGAEVDADDPWIVQGRAWVEREIDAAWRTLREGWPVSNRHATLDLATDGLAYASAHGPLLSSDAFVTWTAMFLDPDNDGWHTSFEQLVERVRAVMTALTGGPLAPAPRGDRWRRAAQDVGWRMLQLMEDVEGEAQDALGVVVDALSADLTEGGITQSIDAYVALHEDWVLPEPVELFAVGYSLPRGMGHSAAQLAAGLAGVLPCTLDMLGDTAANGVARFALNDPLHRVPVARRFAGWLDAEGSPLADQARFEAALHHLLPQDLLERSLEDAPAQPGPLRRTRGVEVLRVAKSVTSQDGVGVEVPEGTPPCWVGVVHRSGEVELQDLTEAEAHALDRAEVPHAPEDLGLDDGGRALRGRGLLSPTAWRAHY